MTQREPLLHHSVAACDEALRAHVTYDPFLCQPWEWTCECGRVWRHVCDEAEGCFYTEITDA